MKTDILLQRTVIGIIVLCVGLVFTTLRSIEMEMVRIGTELVHLNKQQDRLVGVVLEIHPLEGTEGQRRK